MPRIKGSKKVYLSDEDIIQIINLYQTTMPSTHQLAEKFKVGHRKISEILKTNNITINKKGAQVTHDQTELIQSTKTLEYKSSNENQELVAICKKTGIKFNDVNNKSGALTEHITKIYGNVPAPSNNYQRKKYELSKGKKWYEEYFDIIELNIEMKETICCKLCEWKTEDLINQSGAFTKHINDDHKIEISQYLQLFPDQSFLWETILQRNSKIDDNEKSVICLECSKKFLGLTETHMISEHNMTLLQYKNKWGQDVQILSKNTSDILSELVIETNKNMEYTFTSKPQQDIADFITKDLCLDVLLNNKKLLAGIELDILIPSKNVAIEFNGLYYHTEKMGKDKNYHINKTKLCSEKNHKLIHIFEDEWRDKKEIVLSRLRNILGPHNSKLYGRNCVIKEIDSTLKDKFLIEIHIQGADRSSIRLGAFIKDNLVGVMTFSKPRKSLGNTVIENEYELTRFASHSVIGLPSKFLKYFISKYKPQKIVSYADRRWTPTHENCMYEKIGFTYVGETKPNYWYCKGYKHREHRFNYRKDILIKEGYDSSLTEFEIMEMKGYHKIWDCGSFKFEMKFE